MAHPLCRDLRGDPVFRVNPHSSALSRFITAASRGLRELKSPWFAEMRTLRNEERVRRLLHGAGAPLLGGQKSKSKQKREMKEAKELDDPTPFFALAVPRVTYNGMTAGPPRNARQEHQGRQ